jgi:hypothetical protein
MYPGGTGGAMSVQVHTSHTSGAAATTATSATRTNAMASSRCRFLLTSLNMFFVFVLF